MKFKLTLLHKKILAGIGLVVGALLAVGGLIIILKEREVSDVIYGLGLMMFLWSYALVLGCALYLYRAIFKAEELRKDELMKNDERNQLIRGKAAYTAYMVSMIMLGMLANIFILILDYSAAGFTIFGVMVTTNLCYGIAKRIMEKKM
ncbi:MAG: hypothetical protein FWE98_06950 [Oscillospiraceae bacterium]|nr:hypothetical protein [Oscillospiraceae bacterium]